jgi:hypothetical protein
LGKRLLEHWLLGCHWWEHHWLLLVELWWCSKHLILRGGKLLLSIKHLLALNMGQLTLDAILTVRKIVVETSLAHPVSKEGFLISVAFLLLVQSVVEVLSILCLVLLLTDFCFVGSFGLLDKPGINFDGSVSVDIFVDKLAVVALLPIGLVDALALLACIFILTKLRDLARYKGGSISSHLRVVHNYFFNF